MKRSWKSWLKGVNHEVPSTATLRSARSVTHVNSPASCWRSQAQERTGEPQRRQDALSYRRPWIR